MFSVFPAVKYACNRPTNANTCNRHSYLGSTSAPSDVPDPFLQWEGAETRLRWAPSSLSLSGSPHLWSNRSVQIETNWLYGMTDVISKTLGGEPKQAVYSCVTFFMQRYAECETFSRQWCVLEDWILTWLLSTSKAILKNSDNCLFHACF